MGILVDAVLCLILLLFVISGFKRGFIRSFVELVGSIIAVAASIIFSYKVVNLIHPFLAEHVKHIQSFIPQSMFERSVAVVLLYIVLEIIIHIIANILATVFSLPILKQINAVLGGVFGLLKGAVVVLLICTFLQLFLPLYIKNSPKGKINWQQISTSSIYKYTAKKNPVYELFNNDIWHKVGKNESKK